eukprot:3295641-Amphidinium_carterae.1
MDMNDRSRETHIENTFQEPRIQSHCHCQSQQNRFWHERSLFGGVGLAADAGARLTLAFEVVGTETNSPYITSVQWQVHNFGRYWWRFTSETLLPQCVIELSSGGVSMCAVADKVWAR